MDKLKEEKETLELLRSLIITNLEFTAVEIGLIIKMIQLYNLSNDANLLKWAWVFLWAVISTSLVFDYAKDEYNESKREFKYTIGDNYE